MIKNEKRRRDENYFNFEFNASKIKNKKVKDFKTGNIEKELDLNDLRNTSTSDCLDLCKDVEESISDDED